MYSMNGYLYSEICSSVVDGHKSVLPTDQPIMGVYKYGKDTKDQNVAQEKSVWF